jgi:peptidyl-prolyl cis-trans isomerase D
MEAFRSKNVKSAVYGALIVVTVVVFVFGFGSGMGGRASGKNLSIREECVAVIRGHCVTPREYNGARTMFFRRVGGDPAQASAMGLNRVVLDGLIERELLISDANRLGLTVTDAELNEQLVAGRLHVSLPSDKESMAYSLRIDQGLVHENFRDPKTKEFDIKTYERSLKVIARQSPADFRESQSRELLAAKMRDLVKAPVRVSEQEALDAYLSEKSSATLSFVNVPQKFAARYHVAVSDADVDKWAAEEANKKLVEAGVSAHKEGSVPKAGQIRHILVKVDPSATLEAKGLALGRLSEAAARVKKGEPFGEVAREVSEDPGSAQRGGAYGDEMLDKFVEPFKVAAKALKPGEITPGAVETQFGYHLIMRDDPGKAGEVEAALPKSVARDLYVKTKSLEAAKEIGDKIFGALKSGKTMDDAAKLGLTGLKNPNGPQGVTALTIMKAPSAAATGGDAGAASASADAGAATKPAPGKTPALPPGGGPTAAKADAGAGAATASSDAPTVVAKFATAETDPDRPQAQTTSSFNRSGDPPVPGLSGELAAQVIAFAFSAKPGELFNQLIRSDEGYVALLLKERNAATKEDFEKDRETYMQTLLAAKQNEALTLYMKRLRETAKSEIKVNESYLKEPGKDAGAAPIEAPEEE